MTSRTRHLAAIAGALVALSCAARFSPETIRREIAVQHGSDPLSAFELRLGRLTTHLIRTTLAAQGGELPFSGIQQLELGVYEAPGATGPAIDVTRIDIRGWEPVIRAHDAKRSALVLVRSGTSPRLGAPEAGATVGDLVIVGAGPERVVYARLRGTLSSELPSTLGDLLREGGPEAVHLVLTELTESAREN